LQRRYDVPRGSRVDGVEEGCKAKLWFIGGACVTRHRSWQQWSNGVVESAAELSYPSGAWTLLCPSQKAGAARLWHSEFGTACARARTRRVEQASHIAPTTRL